MNQTTVRSNPAAQPQGLLNGTSPVPGSGLQQQQPQPQQVSPIAVPPVGGTVNTGAPSPHGAPVAAPGVGANGRPASQQTTVPSNRTGLTPRHPHPNTPGMTTGLQRMQEKNPSPTKLDQTDRAILESIADQATASSGAVFKDVDNVVVKPPILTALIRLDTRRSPYQLDADSEAPVTLRDVLVTALDSNLALKIVQSESDMKKWAYVGALSGFLPNIGNEINYEALSGTYITPAGFAIPINNPFLTMNSGFTQYLYKGGGIIHSALQNKHEYKASQYAVRGTLNDVLQDVTKLYYGLVLNEVLLQIQVKAVETTRALVLVNEDLFENGVNTQLDVLQAKYKLSEARQALIQQQIARRESAVKLATAINLNPEVDLTVHDRLVSKIRLVDSGLTVADLLRIAIDNRPELKRYEQLRLAAKEQIKVAKSTLLPQVAVQGNVLGSGSRIYPVSPFSVGTGLSTAGVGVGPASIATLPLSTTAPAGNKSWSTRSLFILGVDMQWNLGGLGLKEISQVQSARADARKYTLEFNRALANVYQEVRDSYLNVIQSEQLIVETTDAVNYGAEQLRVSEVRLKDGLGTTLDVINAERDYISALISKANALVQFNVAQSSLLHSIGRESLDTLTTNVPIHE